MASVKKEKRKLSKISAMHYTKLVFRSALFVIALITYVVNRILGTGEYFGGLDKKPLILIFIWIVFVGEMILRFFPSKLESMGCQKQFKMNYREKRQLREKVRLNSWKSTLAVAVAWFILNGAIGVLFFNGIIDEGILWLIAIAYSVCDMICILFYCPFHHLFMKNKCCTTCRIYKR